jgi:hypothetical protein
MDFKNRKLDMHLHVHVHTHFTFIVLKTKPGGYLPLF